MRNSHSTPATQLADLLKQERLAILEGDFARLPALIQAKEQLALADLGL